MSKKIRYILIFLLLALIAAFIVWRYTFKRSDVSMASYKTDVSITAPLLLQAFENNEDSANLKFGDKIIMVTGTVSTVAQDSTGYSVYLKDKDAVSGIMCRFDRTAFNPAMASVGSEVSIKGLCSGYLMDVVLDRCSIMGKPER